VLLCWQRLYRLPRLVQRSEFEFPQRIHHVVRRDDVVAVEHRTSFVTEILIATFSLTPAFRRLRTAERRMSCNVCPEYSGSYGRPSTSVSVPSPQAAQASIHSFRRFVPSKTFVEDTVPGFGSICLSILTSSDDKGTILPSSPLVCSGFNRSCHCQFLRQSGFHSPPKVYTRVNSAAETSNFLLDVAGQSVCGSLNNSTHS
jgi:hypothetical protein